MKGVLIAFFLCLSLFTASPVAAAEADNLILINLSVNQLSLFENGNYIRTFPISSGKAETPTPQGSFRVINKYKNKKYHRKNIDGGARNNPLGTRWLGLSKHQYAIHGTNKEWSIGKYESNGCVRMHDRDVQWLYEHVPIHTRVVIDSFYESPEYAAQRHGYRVTSWNGQPVQEEQIGKLFTIDRTNLYWQEPNGEFTPIQEVMPNATFSVQAHDGKGAYYIGNNLYIFDKERQHTRYEPVPRHLIANQYKRKFQVE